MATPSFSFSPLNALAAVEGEDKVVKMCEEYLAHVREKRAGVMPRIWTDCSGAAALENAASAQAASTPPRASNTAVEAACAALRALAGLDTEPPPSWCWAPRGSAVETPLLRLWRQRAEADAEAEAAPRAWACEAMLCTAPPEASLAPLPATCAPLPLPSPPSGAGAAAAAGAGAPPADASGAVFNALSLNRALLKSPRKNGLSNPEFLRIYNLVYKMTERANWRDGLTRDLADMTRAYVVECQKDHPVDSPIMEALSKILSNINSIFPVEEEAVWSAPCVELEPPTAEVRARLRETCERMLSDSSLSERNHQIARNALEVLARVEANAAERERKHCELHGADEAGPARLGYSQRSDGAYSTFAPLCSCAQTPTAAAPLNDDDLYS